MSLNQLSRERPTSADLQTAMKDLSTQNPRSAAIVAAAYLEDVVRLTLLTKMVSLSNSEDDSIFTGSAPLSSFSAKIQMLYALGIIGKKVRHDLDAVREIRNVFAHAKVSFDFDTPLIAAKLRGLHCLSLAEDPKRLSSPRQCFAYAVNTLLLHLVAKWTVHNTDIKPIADFDPPQAIRERPSEEKSA